MPPRSPRLTLKAFEELMTGRNCRISVGGDWVDAITDVSNEDNNTTARLIFYYQFKPGADPKFGVSIASDDKLPQTPKEISEYMQAWLRIAAVLLTTDKPLMVERNKEAHPKRVAKPTTP
jgi:hypothetical protein